MTTKEEETVEIISKIIGRVVVFFVLFFAYGYLAQYLMHWIFNYSLTYWQSLGLIILCDILFKNKIGGDK